MSQQEQSMPEDSGTVVKISSEIMVAGVIFLFMIVAFVFFLYLYARRYLGSYPSLRRSRSRFIFAADADPLPGRGLDPAVLEALPVTVYRAGELKEGLECAVCLSEISDGEEARLLPTCKHGFHVECIDMWFQSHSTCPLCRIPVGNKPELVQIPAGDAASGDGSSTESPIQPTNVLFWGTRDRVTAGSSTVVDRSQEPASSSLGSSSSSSSRKQENMLVIEIPRQVLDMEEMKSPSSSRFRSLSRLLSRGKQATGDIEATIPSPKTPTNL
ncbi:RING-H2 finger protein ATL3-like [Typha angustifolia]|uniref:RING-H2 finger protein ATL3-like n=1 Tax=Typha angustifolia TaxID=59011 RepID=UPI003C2BC2E5